MKIIAFYLPQFHPVPENDLWWGKGFTDWRNVAKARPNFAGHYQPHIPSDLGFYDLRVSETREAQAELARAYGIDGFCYHHYWFNGRRLLERPFEEVLRTGRPEMPFCLCWANENWTRRWDGDEQEILIAQTHSAHDDRAFIQSLFPAFEDRRYICIDGRPLLVVYRVNLLPDPKATAEIWREECHRRGFPGVHLCAAQSFGITDPRPYGFDSALEFPPHGVFSRKMNHWLRIVNRRYEGSVYDYREVILNSIRSKDPDYCLFRAVMPAWDNTARRQNDSNCFVNVSPEKYEFWLASAIARTRSRFDGDLQLVFINAWNEWGEGCHLEPDMRYGHQFLAATERARRNVVLTGACCGLRLPIEWDDGMNDPSVSEVMRFLASQPEKIFLVDYRMISFAASPPTLSERWIMRLKRMQGNGGADGWHSLFKQVLRRWT